MMNKMDKDAKKKVQQDAVNPRVKNLHINEVNPNAFVKSGADAVPVEAGMINDFEGMSKEAKDLTK